MEPDGPTTVKPWMIAGGVGLLAIVYIWYRNKQAAAANSGATLNTSAYGPPATGTGVLEPIVIGNAGGSTAPTGTPTPSGGSGAPTPVPAGSSGQTFGGSNVVSYSSLPATQVGSGFIYGGPTNNQPVAAANGSIYEYIQNPQQLAALVANKTPVYYSPVPGVFDLSTGQEAGGTPAYYQVQP